MVYLAFFKAFDVLCRGLLRARLVLSGLKKWTLRWVGSWPDDQAQISSVIQSPPRSRSLLESLSDQHLDQHCWTSLLSPCTLGSQPGRGLGYGLSCPFRRSTCRDRA